MNKIRAYFKEVNIELSSKVTWPTWNDLQSSAVLVMIASMLFALVIFGMDASFKFLVKSAYELFLGAN